MHEESLKIGVIGLGYVGLPLALLFSRKYSVVGFDISKSRVEELNQQIDISNEVSKSDFDMAVGFFPTCNTDDLKDVQFYIVAVPTPVTAEKIPDLGPLQLASKLIADFLNVGDIVVYESTVYPGCTEEECVPILEVGSGLKINKDFYCGYSPERINPGDPDHRIDQVVKVTSGSSLEAAQYIDSVYASVITAGTYMTGSIKEAEAAKVIENIQRDINIALMNELARLFALLKLDTQAVLAAARTKWNFLSFSPGLVGGHCIGVDPYYLTHKASEVGFDARMITAGREINDHMGDYVAGQIRDLMSTEAAEVRQAKLLVLGLTFKENCPDTRNSQVFKVIENIAADGVAVDVYDPWLVSTESYEAMSGKIVSELFQDTYDAVFLAVAHDEFKELGLEGILEVCKPNAKIYDLKGILPRHDRVQVL